MEGTKWGTSPDGKYEIVSMTEKTFEDGMNVMRKAFFIDETVSVACELHKNPEAIKELEEICIHAAKDGISLIAIEIATGKVAAAAFNIFQVPHASDENYFVDYQAKCATPSAKCLLQFMIDLENELDIFDYYKIDAFIEIMFMATMKEHRGHALAKLLFQCTIDLSRKLKNGEDVRHSVGWELGKFPQPKLVTALCSSFITQGISKKLGFVNVRMIDFHKWNFNGKSFAASIGPETPATSIDCFVL